MGGFEGDSTLQKSDKLDSQEFSPVCGAKNST